MAAENTTGSVAAVQGGSLVAAEGPYSIWGPTDTPAVISESDTDSLELGVRFRANTAGRITGVRFYKGAGNGGTHTGSVWTTDGIRLATATFTNETATGWQTATFATPVQVQPNTSYIASYFAPQGRYSASYNYFTTPRVNGPLTAPASRTAEPNGVFRYGATSAFPNSTHLSANYWVDVIFESVPLDQGFGGPVLLIKSDAHPFSRYFSEILRAEGIGSFTTVDLAAVTATVLGQHDVAILGEIPLTQAQATMFTDWVNAGGNLIASRPDKKLSGLLGLTDQNATISNAYMLIDPAQVPGLPNTTLQFHSTADRYTATSATTVATLYSNATTATNSPAVTIRQVNSGHAVAFTYDLARSVVQTRQGNPAWAGMERDGDDPLRPVDLFFGAKQGDVQPDWIDFTKVAIPQADEQQRLLTNVLALVNRAKKPIPKTWYLPKGLKAAIVMALDDHGVPDGTQTYFNQLNANTPAGAQLNQWECLRATSWMFVDGATMTDAQAATYHSQGFDLGIHVNTGCADWTPASLAASFTSELALWASTYPSLPAQTGNRTHCIVWSDWATQPKVELSKGIRMDLNYYYAPDWWVQNRPGMFTGSGLPMRFTDVDGSMIDVYQVVSQLVDENGITYPAGIDAMLDKALGSDGYYGVFGTHYYISGDNFGTHVINSAKARGVPMITGKQILDWTDGRNASFFSQIAWSGNNLTFTATVDGRTNGMLRGMLPVQSVKGALTGLIRNGSAVAYTQETIKGVTYAMFPATSGNFSAAYTPHTFPASFFAQSTPTNVTTTDTSAGELGFKFVPAVNGKITHVKFHKGPQNLGTHTVSVWSSTGTRLATATATNETPTGWQTVALPAPLNVTAGQTYIASYFCPGGRYSYDYDYFNQARTSGPLTAPSSVASGGNGVYALGSNFPNQTYRALNYWVDVIFTQ